MAETDTKSKSSEPTLAEQGYRHQVGSEPVLTRGEPTDEGKVRVTLLGKSGEYVKEVDQADIKATS